MTWPLPPIPVLDLDGPPPDAETLETWRESLSSVLAGEVPHSLLALWTVGSDGIELVGPAGLEGDALPVPVPSPAFSDGQLASVEDVVRRAGYGSVRALGLPLGGSDVGLLLIADFPGGLYDDNRMDLVRQVGTAVAPLLARAVQLAGRGAPPSVTTSTGLHELADILDPALPPAEMVAGLSRLLASQLPHDALALVVAEPTLDDLYRLDRHGEGLPWSDLRLVVPAPSFGVARHARGSRSFVVADRDAPDAASAWPPPLDDGERALRAVVGAELHGAQGALGWLLAGSRTPGSWTAADAGLLEQAARIVAPRVEAILLGFQGTVLRSHLGVLRNVPASLARLAELLATTVQFGSALRLFAREASAVLPFSRLEVILRVGTGEGVVRVEPGQSRPIADLPVASVEGTELGRVVGGALPYALATDRRGEEVSGALIVPLRVAGRITGALMLHAQGPDTFARPDVALAQQFADVLAPHLELARRPGGPAPSLPVPPSIRRPARSA